MSDLEISNFSYMKKIEKYMESGILVNGIKSTDSKDKIKPLKIFSENILDDLRRETRFKNKIFKKNKNKKILTCFIKTAKEEYDNFIVVNREKKFKTNFHDSDSRTKKYYISNSPENTNIKNSISIKQLDNNKFNNSTNKKYNEKFSEFKIQKEIELLNEQMYICNLEKQEMLLDSSKNFQNQKRFEINKCYNYIEKNIRTLYSKKNFENHNTNSNFDFLKTIDINNDIDMFNEHNSPQYVCNSNLNKFKTMNYIKNKHPINVFSPLPKFKYIDQNNQIREKNGKTTQSIHIDKNFEIMRNNKEEFSLDDNNTNSNVIISNINFYPMLNRLRENEKRGKDKIFKKNCFNLIKSSCYDSNYDIINAAKNFSKKKTLINFNKNPGLKKRTKLKCDSFDINNYGNNENYFQMYKNLDFNLPKLKVHKNLKTQTNKNYLYSKGDFIDSFNKISDNKNREILLNKNIIFNSATDLEKRLNLVKSMEKSELYRRSLHKVNYLKENLRTSNKYEKDFLILKSKLNKFLTNANNISGTNKKYSNEDNDNSIFGYHENNIKRINDFVKKKGKYNN